MDNNQFNEENISLETSFQYSNVNDVTRQNKKPINVKLVIIIVIVLFILGYLVVTKIINKNGNSEENLMSSNAFYIYDGSHYALFSTDGKQLTDFIFEDDNEFYDHIAAVKNKDGEYAIIKDNGEYMIKFGEYKYISQEGTLFELSNSEGTKYINSQGDTIELDESVDYSIRRGWDFDDQPYLYLAINDDADEIKVLNYEGKVIDTLELYNSLSTANGLNFAKLSISESNTYAVLYYNKHYYLYNLKTRTRIMDSEEELYIMDDSEDGSVLIINKELDNNESYIFFHDGIEKFTVNDIVCDDISVIDGGYECERDHIFRLLDKNGKLIVDDVRAYMSFDTYVKYEDRDYNFYSKGKLVNTLDLADFIEGYQSIVYAAKDKTNYDYHYYFYNSDGQKVNETSYDSVENFDENNVAIVKKDNSYYLIDLKFNKVSDDYDYLSSSRSFYEAKKDKVQYLIKHDGTVLLKGYEELNFIDDKISVEFDNKTIIYNAETLKKLVEIEGTNVVVDEYYAYVTVDGKKNYYSYENGKLFYTES